MQYLSHDFNVALLFGLFHLFGGGGRGAESVFGSGFGEGGVLFKKLMLISDDYGVHSRDSVTTLRGSIFFLDKNSMYTLSGNNIQEAHRPIEDLKTPSITHGTDGFCFPGRWLTPLLSVKLSPSFSEK